MSDNNAKDLGDHEIQAAVERILLSPDFERNRNSCNFLKFIVAETLAGRGGRLKAYSIATLALDRDANFDPQSNSIVRVQATRLRQSLHNYYAGPGADDPVRISLPPGTYQPTFERVGGAPAPAPETVAPVAPAPPVAPEGTHGLRFAVVFLGLAAALGLAALVFFAIERPADPRLQPVLTVRHLGEPSPERSSAAVFLERSLETGLEGFDTFIVRRSEGRPDSGRRVGYALNVGSRATGANRAEFSFILTHEASGQIVYARRFDDMDVANSTALDDMVGKVVEQVGDDYGALLGDFRKRAFGFQGRPSGQLCVLAALDYLKQRSAEKLRTATDCLESDLAAEPDNGLQLALMSVMLVRRYLEGGPDAGGVDDLRRAIELAARAHDVEPREPRSHFALFLGRFYDKRFADAFIAAQRALALNPYQSTMTAVVGSAYISRGDFVRGAAMLRPLQTMTSEAPNSFLAFLAIEKFMLEEYESFRALVDRNRFATTALGLTMRIVACAHAGDAACEQAAVGELRRRYPQSAADIGGMLDRYAFTDAIKARLMPNLASLHVR